MKRLIGALTTECVSGDITRQEHEEALEEIAG